MHLRIPTLGALARSRSQDGRFGDCFCLSFLYTELGAILKYMSEITSTLLVNRAIIADDNRILILRRSQNDAHNASLWEFPGGKVDAGEEIIGGLAREVLEETGLTVAIRSPIAHVESMVIRAGKHEGRLYVALFYIAQRLGGELELSQEHDAGLWLQSDEVARRSLTHESRSALSSFRDLGMI